MEGNGCCDNHELKEVWQENWEHVVHTVQHAQANTAETVLIHGADPDALVADVPSQHPKMSPEMSRSAFDLNAQRRTPEQVLAQQMLTVRINSAKVWFGGWLKDNEAKLPTLGVMGTLLSIMEPNCVRCGGESCATTDGPLSTLLSITT